MKLEDDLRSIVPTWLCAVGRVLISSSVMGGREGAGAKWQE